MKKTNILYWICTALFSLMMIGSALPDLVSAQLAVEGFRQIGMPAYLLPFLGLAKILGTIAVLLPVHPRLKEWAYAGLVFDLLGATWSIYASGQPVPNWAFMALPLALAAASYFLYHKRKSYQQASKNNFTAAQPNSAFLA
ncbi:MAG TPA: DoxX family protein [Chitinophagaceae bacterium]|nr:DoxX family protein [Chitinophagaceae bacterium]